MITDSERHRIIEERVNAATKRHRRAKNAQYLGTWMFIRDLTEWRLNEYGFLSDKPYRVTIDDVREKLQLESNMQTVALLNLMKQLCMIKYQHEDPLNPVTVIALPEEDWR